MLEVKTYQEVMAMDPVEFEMFERVCIMVVDAGFEEDEAWARVEETRKRVEAKYGPDQGRLF